MASPKRSPFAVGLLTDNGEWVRVTDGSPLVLTVGVSNAEASRAAGANSSIARAIDSAGDLVAQGKLTKKDYESKATELKRGLVVPPVSRLGSQGHPWFRSVRFYEVGEGGVPSPLGWPLAVLSNPKPQPFLELGVDQLARASFGMDPELVKELKPGKTKIFCRLASSTSNEVSVEVPGTAPKPSSVLPLANYLYRRERYDEAARLAQNEVAASPGSVGGWYILGEVQEARGELEAAMNSYLKALANLEGRLSGTSSEDPVLLLRKIQDLSYRVKKGPKP